VLAVEVPAVVEPVVEPAVIEETIVLQPSVPTTTPEPPKTTLQHFFSMFGSRKRYSLF